MTKDEAIKVLKRLLPVNHIDDVRTAIDMAIEALQREEAVEEKVLNRMLEKGFIELPSAGRLTGEWIPVSERLPEQSNDYICTIPLDGKETFVKVLTFHKGSFYEDDDEWGATFYHDVIAWMPLPKPYREDGEE